MSNPLIQTLADIPEFHARQHPQKISLVYGANQVSFEQLDQRSNQLANALCSEGLEPQANIAFMDRNSEHFFYILFGASKANTSLVTVNFRLTEKEIAYILDDAEAELIFVGREYLESVVNCQSQLSRLKKIVVIDSDDEDGLSSWISNHSTTRPQDRLAAPTDRAMQMYTSGTTGHPKGVELSQYAMVVAAIEGLSVWPAMYEPDAAVLATMPLFHIAAANLGIAGLYAGARAEIMRDASPGELIRIIAEHGIRVVPLPATVIHEIINLPNIDTFDLSKLDTLLIAGSGIAVELLREAQRVLGCGFALSYGMTECCGGLTYLGPDVCVHDAGKKLLSAGRPIGNCQVKIASSDGQDLPTGEIGEIVCKSDRVMTSYWNRPEATAEATRDGWYLSGDAGYLDDEGFLYVVDRIKDMVVSGGENIYPVEIENELMKHPSVDDVAVIGVPDEKWGEALLANIILKQGQQVPGEELTSFLRSSLAGYKIPRRYEFVTAFPRNATGKVLKREMRKKWANIPESSA
jgi:long-chain acyl-CoA synthetase